MAKIIGKYEIINEIDKGGFGVVYRATDANLNRTIALKVLHFHFSGDPGAIARFQQEARTIAALDHPNIVPVYDVGQDGEYHYIAMKYLPGGSLAQRIARGPMPFAQALPILRDACAGLQEAHGRGYVHLDVKPANILFDGRGQALISDFGLARAFDSRTSSGVSSYHAATWAYCPPERMDESSAPPGPQADVFALGCILYEMLTGQALFTGTTAQVMKKILLDPHPVTVGWRPEGAPADIGRVIAKAIAKKPEMRYPNAAAFYEALEKLALPATAGERSPAYVEPPAERSAPAYSASFRQTVSSPLPPPSTSAAPVQPRIPRWAIFALAGGALLSCLAVALVVINLILNPAGKPPAVLSFFAFTPGPTRTPTLTFTPTPTPTPLPTPTPRPTPIPIHSANGKIAFVYTVSGAKSINIMNADGSNRASYIYYEYYLVDEPAWSPDGQWIAFTRNTSDGDIYLGSADLTKGSQLTNTSGKDGHPDWSPDGKKIVFQSERSGNSEIYVMSSDGLNQTNLTNSPSKDFAPDWSPDGSKIAFASDRAGAINIFIMDADGGNVRQATVNAFPCDDPDWSPDGTKILFTANINNNADIFVMDADGGNARQLTSSPGDDYHPQWSPDGTKIVFVSKRDGNAEILEMDPDGRNVANLTSDDQTDDRPAWQPVPRP